MPITIFLIALVTLVAVQLAAGILVDGDQSLPHRLPEA